MRCNFKLTDIFKLTKLILGPPGNLMDPTWHHFGVNWDLYGHHFAKVFDNTKVVENTKKVGVMK